MTGLAEAVRSGETAGAEVGEETVGDAVAGWREAAVVSRPAERAVAEAGVRLAYRRAGLPEPERIVWAGSPREAVRLVVGGPQALGGAPGRSVRDEIRSRPWAAERQRLHAELGPVGWAAHWGATGGQLWDSVQALAERLRAGLIEELAVRTAGRAAEEPPGEPLVDAQGSPVKESQLRLILLDAVLGQHDAAWLCAFDTAEGGPLDGLAAVARSAGWWWPFERVAVVCERPTELHRDEAGRLDHAEGPALAFPDGFSLYAWRGMPVPGDFLKELSALTPERIREEENAELRRVMLEHFGYDRYLTESGAVPVHRDETGVLWRIALTGDEDVVMVEVVNSTPEPDGTSRTYWLRVPPTTRTAKEGVAWTFGLAAEAYEPERQT
ncbi:DUF6745 domain-containing protein [Streptomyces sp. NPDC091292]|uniref:DUF6745 domain-containing protein n=1 Tax=Streptomyces sp. NPDC091292 TaxID=3365991 RepID=UPI003822005B